MSTLPAFFEGPRRWRLLRLSLIGLSQAVAGVMLILTLQRVGQIGPGADTDSLAGSAVSAALLLLLLMGLRWRAQVEGERLGQGYVHQVRLRLYRHLIRLGWYPLRQRSRGALALRFVGDLSAVRNWVTLGIAPLVVNGVLLTVLIAGLWYVSAPLALAVSAILGTTGLLAWLIAGPLMRETRSVRRQRGRLAALVADRLERIEVVTHLGLGKRELDGFRRRSRKLRDLHVARSGWIGLLRALGEGAAMLTGMTVLLLSGSGAVSAVSGESVLSVLLIGTLMAPRLQELCRIWEYWQSYRVAREKQLQLLALRPWPDHRRRGKGLRLEAVVVEAGMPPLNADLAPGTRARVPADSTGCRLLRIIAGLEPPVKGRVRLPAGGRGPVRALLVSARLPLLRGTLRDNLLAGVAKKPDKETLVALLERCGLAAPVELLPQGLDTPLELGGEPLGADERFRLQLARALLIRPRWLLIDRPEGALNDAGLRLLAGMLADYESGWLLCSGHPFLAGLAGQMLHPDPPRLVEVNHELPCQGARNG